MKNLDLARLVKIISDFDKARVLVIGDVMIDEFIWGKVSRISPEAPVPVVWVNRESFMPGGASNVANNIRALYGNSSLASVIGKDERGRILSKELKKLGINTEGVFIDKSRPTTLKTRVIAHHQQVVRIDKEKPDPIDEDIITGIINFAKKKIDSIDGIIIEDYGKGLIVSRLVKEIVKLGKAHKKIITVDPKIEHFEYYKGVTSLTPNHFEAGNAVNIDIKDDKSLALAGKKLMGLLKSQTLLITLGENGMCLFEKNNMTKIPTVAQEVFDVCGAGDTVISAFTLALCAGATPLEAAHIANCAAGIVVGKVGIAVVTPDELIERIEKEVTK